MTPTEALRLIFERYRSDPIAFCADMFPDAEQPREWQPEVLEQLREAINSNDTRRLWFAVAACRKAGKTRLAAFIAIWFLCTHANSLVLTVAPTWQQVKDALWADIRYLWLNSKLPQIFPAWEPLQTEIKTHPLTPKWRAIGLTSDDVQNLEGRHPASGQPALVIIDESKGVPDIFFESLQGMLGEAGVASILLAIGTPGVPLGWFYRAFARERHLWRQFKIKAPDIPRLAERAKERCERVGEEDPFYRQQELAEFTGGDEGQVIPFTRVEMAIGRTFALDASWPLIASLDPASTGSDDSVLTLRRGPVVLKTEDWQGWDPMQSSSRVAQRLREWKPAKFIYDAQGLGDPIGSRIKELTQGTGIAVHEFRAGAAPKDTERYANLKAEEVFYLQKRFLANVPDATGAIGPDISIPDHPLLIEQLCAWTATYSERGKTKIVDPDDSPDFADSCLMAFAADRLGQSVRGVTPKFLT